MSIKDKLDKITVKKIDDLIFDMTKLGSYIYNISDKNVLSKEFEDIKQTIAEMAQAITSFELNGDGSIIIDPNNKDYDPIKVFQRIIFPIYKLGNIIDYHYNPRLNKENMDIIKEELLTETYLMSCILTLEFSNNWKTEIEILFPSIPSYNNNNGDIILPVKGLDKIPEILLLKRYIEDLFKEGDVYVYIHEPNSEYNRKVYLAFKNSSNIEYEAFKGVDEEEEEWWMDNSFPYLTPKPFMHSHIVDRLMQLIKEPVVEEVKILFSLKVVCFN